MGCFNSFSFSLIIFLHSDNDLPHQTFSARQIQLDGSISWMPVVGLRGLVWVLSVLAGGTGCVMTIESLDNSPSRGNSQLLKP